MVEEPEMFIAPAWRIRKYHLGSSFKFLKKVKIDRLLQVHCSESWVEKSNTNERKKETVRYARLGIDLSKLLPDWDLIPDSSPSATG